MLKDEWGFKGFVMSNWGAVHDVDSTLNAGCDLEMPCGEFLTKTVDDKIRRMLRTMLTMGLLDSPKIGKGALGRARCS